jgi:hypothetical protein
MSKPKYHFGTVVWHDAHASLDEFSEDEIKKNHKPSLIETRGWILVSDDTGVTYASEWLDESQTWRGVGFIPRGMVVSETKKAKRTRNAKQSKEPGQHLQEERSGNGGNADDQERDGERDLQAS